MTPTLVVLVAVAVWVLSLYVHPFSACSRCRGRGRVMRGTAKRPRPVTCPRCMGLRRRQRPGSRTVHQLARRVRIYRTRQRKLRTTPTQHEE